MRSIINILDLSAGEIDQLIAVADDIMAQPEKYNEVCRHKILATLFFEPSTRTRLSFESAMLSLGGKVLEFFLLIGLEQVIEGMHRKGIPYIFRRGGHEYDQHLRVGLPQPAGSLDAVGARHADIQKHHGV
jgi:hypothetical protein